jgi:toxin-antitoxin system PIN domain toxin
VIIPDVNVLVYALRDDAQFHAQASEWLQTAMDGDDPVRLTPAVAMGAVRIMTHPKIFAEPDTIEDALGKVDHIVAQTGMVERKPGHWALFRQLCEAAGVTGNLVSDADHAATAIENDATFASRDTDFGKFATLSWTKPF